MTIRLHNTLTRQKEELVPLNPKNVRMYVCGPTVYDYAHIGNARPAIVFDVLYRLLRHTYGADHVTYVRNITDIDDKINARAAEIAAAKGVSVEEARVEVTNRTAQQYLDDVAALGCLLPNHTPRATEYVDGMKDMINALIAAGHAYAAEGHVLYDVSSKPDYGKLSRRSLDEMMAGARVEVAPYKKNPMDFVLWKPSDENTPGWDSPLQDGSRGRPGWHIECSVMAGALLKDTFDIHGGGVDLMFPHHENEIAQSEGCHHGAPLAQVWMHNGFLQVEGEKMSKSLGNFITINELLNMWPGTALRMAMLMTHYRQPIDWTERRLGEVDRELREWVEFSLGSHNGQMALAGVRADLSNARTLKPQQALVEALSEDLNTSNALTVLRNLFDAARRGGDIRTFIESAVFLGLIDPFRCGAYQVTLTTGVDKPDDWSVPVSPNVKALQLAVLNHQDERVEELKREIRKSGANVDISDQDSSISLSDDAVFLAVSEINDLIAARSAARKAKNFAESDRIRDELLAKGIVLKDGPQGTTWEVKR